MDAWEIFKAFLMTFAVVSAIAFTTGLILLFAAIRRLRRIELPPNAGFWESIRAVPLSLVVAIDLLDLGLDFLAAPLVWFILRRSKLTQLRNFAVIEALLPFTGPLPTLTIAWIIARALPPGFEPFSGSQSGGVGSRRYKTIDAEFTTPQS